MGSLNHVFGQNSSLFLRDKRMRFFSYVNDARKTITSNKMRSWLSTLGIVIGMAAVIVMMAIGQGMDSLITQNMGDMAQNKLSISSNGGYQTENPNGESTYVKKIVFDTSIIDYISNYFPELSGQITYQVEWASDQIKIKNNSDYVSAIGVPQNWFSLNEKDVVEWMGFTDQHYKNLAFVAIVNNAFKEKFYPNSSPLGKKFTLGKKEYTIIGVLKKWQFEFGGQAYVPDTTVLQRIKHSNELSSFDVFLDKQADNAEWNKRLTYLLMKKFNVDNAASAWFEITTFAEFVKKIEQTTGMMKNFLLFIGGLSLLIWGIWVMNIMIVSVTERTREIWIRKAIGALNRDIILQFLIESVVITLIWGIIALLLSFVVVQLINAGLASQDMGPDESRLTAVINGTVVLLSFFLTAMTGIIFGILPAKKAAKLKPIDALRFE